MKKYILFSIAFLLCFSAHSQLQLWGMTSSGGKDNGGVIFNVDASGNNYKLEYEFSSFDFADPFSNKLIQATDGMIYGLTTHGGVNNEGVLFQYDPSNLQYTVKFSFKEATGSDPEFLMQAKDGMLYGLTHSGGANRQGVLFQYNLNTDTYVVKFNFSMLDGIIPVDGLVQAKDGMLYGIMQEGGNENGGTLFQYNPLTSAYTRKIDFKRDPPYLWPTTALVLATDGMLYGILTDVNGSGTLFQYNPVTAVLTKKTDFDSLGGNFPSSMIQATDGMLYGTMRQGGANNKGILFQYNPATSKYSKKIDFDGANGNLPVGSLTEGNDGMLYGLTAFGGIEEYSGVLFQYNPTTVVLTKKMDLLRKNTGYTSGGMMLASDGMLYGMMTSTHAFSGGGIIFQYNPVTAVFTTKRDTDKGSLNGKFPFGSLMRANDGMLYGLSYRGGITDSGTLFQFNPISHSYTKKFDFSDQNGEYPYASLIQATDGMVYGMTTMGGKTSDGVLFQYNPFTSTYVKKMDFLITGEAGCSPFGSLIQSRNGLLYGMTSNFGKAGGGTLFQYDLSSSKVSAKYNFKNEGPTGNAPLGSLLEASDGMLYGFAGYSYPHGVGDGTLFQFDPVTAAYALKFSFDDPAFVNPTGSLIQAKDGMLYGMTKEEEGKRLGYLFQYDPVTSVLTKKFDFDSINGSIPMGSLMEASNGMLYGMTSKGGTHDLGVLFQYNPTTSVFTKKMDFNGKNGAHPTGDLIEINTTVGITEDDFTDAMAVFPNPTTGSFHLKIPFHDRVAGAVFTDKMNSIEITNVLGEKVTELAIINASTGDKSADSFLYSIDISKFKAGVYFLNVKTDTHVRTKKVIKE